MLNLIWNYDYHTVYLYIVSAEEDCTSLAQETPEGSENGDLEEPRKGLNYYIGKPSIGVHFGIMFSLFICLQ